MRQRLFLLSELVRRDLSSRFAGSFGGLFWAFLNPVLMCVLYGVVFGVILRIRAPEGFAGGYAVYLLGGLLPWIGFHEAVTRGATAMTDQVHLVKKVPFAVELLVVSVLWSALVLQAVALVPLLAFAAASDRLHPSILHLAAAFGLEALLLVGPLFALAALNVFFRDLPQLLGPLMLVVFYMTPILYPESQVPPALRPILSVNPVGDVVGLFRAGLFGTSPPSLARVSVVGALALAGAFLGLGFFRRARPSFSDLL